jgi:hypothetical protein
VSLCGIGGVCCHLASEEPPSLSPKQFNFCKPRI